MNDDVNVGRLSAAKGNMAAVCRRAAKVVWNSLRSLCSLWLSPVPFLVVLLFLGAMFWAEGQDPFSRRWFSLRTADHRKFDCVAVLPKPVRRCPVVVLAHGSGDSLMSDGNDLRQMAELGLATVSLEYDQTNEAVFQAEWSAVQEYIGRQAWADTNRVAWVGCSLGANWIGDFLQNKSRRRGNESLAFPILTIQASNVVTNQSETPHVVSYGANPRSLVLVSGQGLPDAAAPISAFSFQNFSFSTLLVHGEEDEVFPVADTRRLAEILRTNGVAVSLRVVPGAPHNLQPERAVAFRGIGEFCLTNFEGREAWRNYHSIAEWQAEAPGLGWFWIPAFLWVGWGAWRRARSRERAERREERGEGREGRTVAGGQPSGVRSQESAVMARAEVRLPRSRLAKMEAALRWVAGLMAGWALVVSGLHLVPPHLVVSERALGLARRFSVQPKERADFEYLAAQPIWSGVRLRVLLDHVELAEYNRELINWQVEEGLYREFVLEPVIERGAGGGEQGAENAESIKQKSEAGSQESEWAGMDWRRPLWEEFYPRIRHESSPGEAARIVARHLHERVSVVALPGMPRSVPEIWRRQVTDEAGFAIIYVAALRSVGVPARLTTAGAVEFWDGEGWRKERMKDEL